MPTCDVNLVRSVFPEFSLQLARTVLFFSGGQLRELLALGGPYAELDVNTSESSATDSRAAAEEPDFISSYTRPLIQLCALWPHGDAACKPTELDSILNEYLKLFMSEVFAVFVRNKKLFKDLRWPNEMRIRLTDIF